LVPEARTIGALVHRDQRNAETVAAELQSAARALGLDGLHLVYASAESEIDMAFATFAQLHVGAVVLGASAFFSSRPEQLAALSNRHALPTIFYTREFATAGGLMSYGGNNTDAERQAAVYVGRILKGERPENLPVQQAVKVELVLNLKTAKALGITFPLTLLDRADECPPSALVRQN
jgi:putative ABC transport system substrate-binding protein